MERIVIYLNDRNVPKEIDINNDSTTLKQLTISGGIPIISVAGITVPDKPSGENYAPNKKYTDEFTVAMAIALG